MSKKSRAHKRTLESAHRKIEHVSGRRVYAYLRPDEYLALVATGWVEPVIHFVVEQAWEQVRSGDCKPFHISFMIPRSKISRAGVV